VRIPDLAKRPISGSACADPPAVPALVRAASAMRRGRSAIGISARTGRTGGPSGRIQALMDIGHFYSNRVRQAAAVRWHMGCIDNSRRLRLQVRPRIWANGNAVGTSAHLNTPRGERRMPAAFFSDNHRGLLHWPPMLKCGFESSGNPLCLRLDRVPQARASSRSNCSVCASGSASTPCCAT
jgi:hypothetical protein